MTTYELLAEAMRIYCVRKLEEVAQLTNYDSGRQIKIAGISEPTIRSYDRAKVDK